MMRDRLILHIDINSFYAQVELLDKPELRNLPVAVGGDVKQRHGVILAKNEAAKRYAVKTGESLYEARQKCPGLIVLPPHHVLYHDYSEQAMDIYRSRSNKVESFGLDEAWLDLSSALGNTRSWQETAEEVSEALRQEVFEKLKLTVSIGVSWNKSYAKLGSDYRKPDAVTIISRSNYREIVWPLPVGRLLYVGPVSQKRLGDTGILTIGQLAAADDAFLASILGKSGPELGRMARGEDTAAVLSEQEQQPRRSVGSSRTYAADLKDLNAAEQPLRALAEEVSSRLKEQGLRGQTVHVFIRNNQFQDKSRQRQLRTAIQSAEELYEEAHLLLQMHENFNLPIRALGISVSSLIRAGETWQPSLFDLMNDIQDDDIDGPVDKGSPSPTPQNRKRRDIEDTIFRLHEKYGAGAVDFGDIIFHTEDDINGDSSER